ncbi:ATP-binding protein [Edaphobacter albus]|uniref:ATP-binding protein n=1 Tax=Edaphobacter sp. 4G125 TaxID=2763071 RepID=UPI001644CF46|nr:ATP-binding protein [Edaphobacter sp. 4G125]QNI35234.1 HAMP domain-containing protein [Edaphobacter sp. 4G125]
MNLPNRSLFLKILLWFWGTIALTAFSMIVTLILQPTGMSSQWHDTLIDTTKYAGATIVQEYERHGTQSASEYLLERSRTTHLRACLLHFDETTILGNGCLRFAHVVHAAVLKGKPEFNFKYGVAEIAVPVQGATGERYIYVTESPTSPRSAGTTNVAGVVVRCLVALLVPGLICYLLTRYLTAPILRLREASQQLATGNLNARADERMSLRRDELGSLVRDFNVMAGRLEGLVSGQRQLIYDISHELRSPLTRLNVALDIGRERKGNDQVFDQMQQDLERMNQMIERLLTLARLDVASASVPFETFNLTDLVANLVHSAGFELHERPDNITMNSREIFWVRGNAELLQSAIENVIRNAIRYNNSDEPVQVVLERMESLVQITVRDHGPGVPSESLQKIFEPFYRVASDRDRQTGGAGLGLAITERAIRMHGGKVYAENATPHGLAVYILLPSSDQTSECPFPKYEVSS